MNKKWLVFTLCGFLSFAAPPMAQADVSVSPLRVYFDSRDRSAEVTLLNLSKDTKTYRMSWVNHIMTEMGKYEKIDGPLSPLMDLEKQIVFSPRQVRIPGDSRQKVRLSLRRPPDLPDGEYRAHLKFVKLIDDQSSQAQAPEKGVTTQIMVNVGLAIPVIVRQGEYNAQAEITNPKFIPANLSKGGQPQLELTIKRSGLHSTIGRVMVYWDQIEARNGRIGVLNNVSVYPELDQRIIRVNLSEENILSGTVTVRYEGEGPDKGLLFDEKSFPIGG